jgi:hypothetical protein
MKTFELLGLMNRRQPGFRQILDGYPHAPNLNILSLAKHKNLLKPFCRHTQAGDQYFMDVVLPANGDQVAIAPVDLEPVNQLATLSWIVIKKADGQVFPGTIIQQFSQK